MSDPVAEFKGTSEYSDGYFDALAGIGLALGSETPAGYIIGHAAGERARRILNQGGFSQSGRATVSASVDLKAPEVVS